MQTKLSLNQWKIFFQWTFGNILGIAVVAPIATILFSQITTPILALLFRVFSKLGTLTHLLPVETDRTSTALQATQSLFIPTQILETCVLFLLVGIFQWLILRPRLVNPKRWIWATFIGLWAGILISTPGARFASGWGLSETTVSIMAGAILGATLGTAQWLILRKSVNSAGLWILANMIGLSAGTASAWPIISNIHDDSIGIFIFLAIALLVLISTYSVVTGLFLSRLLDQPVENQPAATV